MIVPMTAAHSGQVLAIYQAGIDEGNATFETAAPEWPTFDEAKLPEHRFTAVEAGAVLGWVAASKVSDRCVYGGVVEHSVYVAPPHGAAGSPPACSRPSSTPPKPPGSGPSSPGSSPRTSPA